MNTLENIQKELDTFLTHAHEVFTEEVRLYDMKRGEIEAVKKRDALLDEREHGLKEREEQLDYKDRELTARSDKLSEKAKMLDMREKKINEQKKQLQSVMDNL